MRTIKIVASLYLLIALCLALYGCTATDRSRIGTTYSDTPHKITLYTLQGPIVFHTRGKVESEEHSDGWHFIDKSTGRLVLVSGTIVAEEE